MPLEFIIVSSIKMLTIILSFVLVVMARTLLRNHNIVYNAPRVRLFLSFAILTIGLNAMIDYSYFIYRFMMPLRDCSLIIKHPDCYRPAVVLDNGRFVNFTIHNNYDSDNAAAKELKKYPSDISFSKGNHLDSK